MTFKHSFGDNPELQDFSGYFLSFFLELPKGILLMHGFHAIHRKVRMEFEHMLACTVCVFSARLLLHLRFIHPCGRVFSVYHTH